MPSGRGGWPATTVVRRTDSPVSKPKPSRAVLPEDGHGLFPALRERTGEAEGRVLAVGETLGEVGVGLHSQIGPAERTGDPLGGRRRGVGFEISVHRRLGPPIEHPRCPVEEGDRASRGAPSDVGGEVQHPVGAGESFGGGLARDRELFDVHLGAEFLRIGLRGCAADDPRRPTGVRVGGGEPLFGIPPTIPYPEMALAIIPEGLIAAPAGWVAQWYDPVTGALLFPARICAAAAGLLLLPVVSRLTARFDPPRPLMRLEVNEPTHDGE